MLVCRVQVAQQQYVDEYHVRERKELEDSNVQLRRQLREATTALRSTEALAAEVWCGGVGWGGRGRFCDGSVTVVEHVRPLWEGGNT